jgi:hypothetical protein
VVKAHDAGVSSLTSVPSSLERIYQSNIALLGGILQKMQVPEETLILSNCYLFGLVMVAIHLAGDGELCIRLSLTLHELGA